MKKIFITTILTFLFVLGLSGAAWAGSVTVAWNPNSESDLAGYKLYYWKDGVTPIVEQMVDVLNVTTYEITGLTTGKYYIIEATAYDTSNNESERSYGVRGKANYSAVKGLRIP